MLFSIIMFAVIGFLFLTLALYSIGESNYNSAILLFLGSVLLLIAFFLPCISSSTHQDIPSQYYLEAEVLATDNTSKVTVFTSEQGKYSTQGVYCDIAPYLLTMGDKGTDDTADDEIIVIWRAVG